MNVSKCSHEGGGWRATVCVSVNIMITDTGSRSSCAAIIKNGRRFGRRGCMERRKETMRGEREICFYIKTQVNDASEEKRGCNLRDLGGTSAERLCHDSI